jgi:hypothetical protein
MKSEGALTSKAKLGTIDTLMGCIAQFTGKPSHNGRRETATERQPETISVARN